MIGSKNVTGLDVPGSRAKVFFTPVIDAEHLFKLYRRVNEGIYGRTAIKLHTGEKNGPNILPHDLVRDFRAVSRTATSLRRTPSTKVTVIRRKDTAKR